MKTDSEEEMKIGRAGTSWNILILIKISIKLKGEEE